MSLKSIRVIVILTIITVFLNNLLWALVIPYNEAPDEYTHFEVSRFIADKNRLPNFLKDDNMGVSKYEKQGYRAFYNASYSIMPPLAYLIQAGAIKIFAPFWGDNNLYLSARFSSVFLSVLFVFIVWKIAKELFENKLQQLSLIIFCSFIPQISFTFSYVNSDALGIVVSSLLIYYLILVIKKRAKINYKNSLYLGLLIGLGLLTRYNIFVVFPFTAVFYLAELLKIKEPVFKKIKKVLLVVFPVLIIAGWWYVRNLILYGELLGTKNFWKVVHMLHPPKDIGKSFYTPIYILFKTNWLWENFKSFWASFGWNYIFLAEFYYRILLFLGLCSLVGLVIEYGKNKTKRKLININAGLFVFSLLLSLWQSWKYAYQAQGRYFFPVIIAVGWLFILGLFSMCKDELFKKTIFVFINLFTIFLNVYSLLFIIIPVYY